jgi:hypothetical protein
MFQSLRTFLGKKRLLALSCVYLSVCLSVCMPICLSVHMRETTWLPLDRFALKMVFHYFLKICQEVSSFIEIGENNGYFTLRPIYIGDNNSLSSSQNEKYFS